MEYPAAGCSQHPDMFTSLLLRTAKGGHHTHHTTGGLSHDFTIRASDTNKALPSGRISHEKSWIQQTINVVCRAPPRTSIPNRSRYNISLKRGVDYVDLMGKKNLGDMIRAVRRDTEIDLCGICKNPTSQLTQTNPQDETSEAPETRTLNIP